jgi:pimeloyl-ACP methyl ester carboxylesterase
LSDVLAHEDAERFAGAFPDARYVQIADAGHTVQGDNPRALATALLEFLRETGAG